MSAILIPLLFILACFSTSLGSDLSVPRWENLECEVSNHYYYLLYEHFLLSYIFRWATSISSQLRSRLGRMRN